MKKSILISLLVGMMGAMAFMGCEKPEPTEAPVVSDQQTTDSIVINPQAADTTVNEPQQQGVESQDTAANPASFLIGEWVVNVSMSEGLFNDNYTDTLLFTTNGIIEKHSVLSGSPYSVLNDTTMRIERPHRIYDVIFTYYPPNGIMFYNFWDNTLEEVIKNIYYERVCQ